jgi:5-hydroxyisourate hydrolase
MSISTHVLDTAEGRPAAGVGVVLEALTADGGWLRIGRTSTNDDGRAPGLTDDDTVLDPGVYRMSFETGEWFAAREIAAFYPVVRVVFEITDGDQHHHVPLLLSPFGYSTYRGS